MKRILLGFLLVALLAGDTLAAEEYEPHSVLIVLDVPSIARNMSDKADKNGIAFSNALMTQANSVAAVVGARVMNTYPEIAIEQDKNIVHIRSESKPAEQLKAELEKIPGVLSVSLNYIVMPSAVICDPLPRFPNDRYYKDGYLWAQQAFGLVRANANDKKVAMWDYLTGDGSVVVAIIDDGVAYDHPDLEGVVMRDSFGYYGRQFHSNGQVSDEQHPSKRNTGSHGTHVAGIVGAIGNNSTGVVGACWNVRLLPVNVFTYDPAQKTSTSRIVDVVGGINYVVSEKRKGMNIRVANMSLGYWTDIDPQDMEKTSLGVAVRAMTDVGILVVVSAGNDFQNLDNPTGQFAGKKPYPASFTFTNVVCVGALGRSNIQARYSNYGKRIDFWAPGGSSEVDGIKKTILSTIPLAAKSINFGTKGYDYMEGTSQAAPLVAGYFALLFMGQRGIFPDQNDNDSAAQIIAAVNAAREDEDNDGNFTLNLFKAMVELNGGEYPFAPLLPTPVPEPETPPTSTGSSGGCEVGFGAIAIFAVAILTIKRRK